MEEKIDLSKEHLSGKVTNYLRKRILIGNISAGTHLSEVQLSKKLSISRGPLREAIFHLENEGLVNTPNNGRTLVVGLDEKDLNDLFEVRRILEATAIQTIIDQGFNTQLADIYRILEQMKKTDSRSFLMQLDIEFHYRLMKLSHNRTLIKLWTALRGLVSTLIEITTDFYGELDNVTTVHGDILNAISEGQTTKAIDILTEHLRIGQASIHDYLSKNKVVGGNEYVYTI